MSVRLILTIIGNLAWGAVLVAVVLWLLPRLEIYIPLPGLVALLAAFAAYAVVSYRIASRALSKKPEAGLTSMIGSRGKVVSPLTPRGMVRIKGELWEAVSKGSSVGTGEEIIVVGQDGLRLIVDRVKSRDDRD